MKEIISQEVIEEVLNGADPEEYITGLEYEYRTNTIYKIIQHPEKGKIIRKDTLTAFLWVDDLTGLNFYGDSKARQRQKMTEYGITIEVLETEDNERLQNGFKYLVKSSKGYRDLLSFFRQGGLNPWDEDVRKHFILLNLKEQYLKQKEKKITRKPKTKFKASGGRIHLKGGGICKKGINKKAFGKNSQWPRKD